LTVKHNINVNNSDCSKYFTKYFCTCGKEFKHHSSLYRHKKSCIAILNDISNASTNSNIVYDLIKQNQEFKQLILDQNKQHHDLQSQIVELSKEKEGNIINHTTNNTTNNFNLHIFLNEKCKDAMNINDFVNSLQLQFTDLENMGKVGYVNGITKIFVKGLQNLDLHKRPIHCSDLKREIMYVKDENKWEKENTEKKRLKQAIKKIEHNNIKLIPGWAEKYPESKDSESKKNIQFNQIVNHSMGGSNVEEDEDNYNRILKNIAKEVVIEK